MKIFRTIVISAVFAATAVMAQSGSSVEDAAPETPGTVVADGSAATPTTSDGSTATTTDDKPNRPPVANSGESKLDQLTPANTYETEWHMKPVRVVHARVQSDTPALMDGQFVSSYGADLEGGYLSAMDNVNTASVEGALMYVQAEGINQNSRSKEDRCARKNNMNHVVFYEILIAQTNETIAQFSDKWNAPEYGPMIPMDSGRCTPLATNKDGSEELPVECLQFNGDDGQPNIGPFVGGGLKDDDVRAPYPDTYWFSFPHTCPTQPWGAKKTDECRDSSRKGLCDVGKSPDGVECTFAYNILGWVAIDDVVGITNITNPDTKKPYTNFTEWCMASEENVEFAGDDKTGERESGLEFWADPLDSDANAMRAAKVVTTYDKMLAGELSSPQIDADLVADFVALPTIEQLRASNPPCYESVPSCNSGNGCRREGFSQLCKPCQDASDLVGCETDADYVFPKLAKAETELSDEELTSGSKLGATTPASADEEGSGDSASSSVTVAFAAVASTVIAALML